jgi:Clp amino terminal domain, pathogenicity island component/UvrB/uvrC motif
MFERFTNQSRRVVVLAQEEARMLDHNYIGTEHLLLGLLNEGRGSAARALQAMDITLQAVRDQVIEIIGRGQAQPSGHIPFTPRAKKSLELSLREALQLGDGYIGTGHLLLGLTHQGDNMAVKILGSLGADLKDLRARVTEDLRGNPEEGQDVPSAEREQQQQLKAYLRGEAKGLLDTIDDRLTAIERRLGIRRPVPVAMRNLEVRIAQVRRDKQAAIDVQDFEQAVALRDAEKQLIEERARVEQETAASTESAGDVSAEGEAGVVVVAGVGADVVAGVGADVGAEADEGAVSEAGAGVGEPGELGRLRARVADLESRLREHGIDPDEPGEAPAATG